MANERRAGSVRNVALGVAAGVALAWFAAGHAGSRAAAQQSGAGAEAGSTIAFSAGGNGSPQMLYLIDTKAQSFAVYRIDPTNPKGAVKLEGARQYRWDLKLAEFSNQPPDVGSIESMVGSPRGK